MIQTYEEVYLKENHFSFGRNWQDFLKTLNQEKIEEAKKSLIDFLGGEEEIRGKSFIDIGSGSGLFSLAALQVGASRVVSVDVDDFSIACATFLRKKENNPAHWEIKQGSALDKEFLKSLGQFDVVYSWGVLHHTGDMYQALENVQVASQPSGKIYLALYNRYEAKWRGGTSYFWLSVKKAYNHYPLVIKKIFEILFMGYGVLSMLISLKNPLRVIREYKGNRGMSWYHDRIDWLGGLPYEFASLSEIVNFFGKSKIFCKKLRGIDGIGCNEFLFVNLKEEKNV